MQNSANLVLRIKIFMLTKTVICSLQIFLEGALVAIVAVTLGIFCMAQKGYSVLCTSMFVASSATWNG